MQCSTGDVTETFQLNDDAAPLKNFHFFFRDRHRTRVPSFSLFLPTPLSVYPPVLALSSSHASSCIIPVNRYRMTFASPSSPTWALPSEDRSAPRPQPPRRPSAMRSSSSDHIITPAVTRFDPETSDIPPSPTFPNPAQPSSALTDNEPSLNPSKSPLLETPPPAPPMLSHRAATSPIPTTSKVTSTSPPTSLLARRRSSRSTARPNFLPKT